jgi:hypothetical protein
VASHPLECDLNHRLAAVANGWFKNGQGRVSQTGRVRVAPRGYGGWADKNQKRTGPRQATLLESRSWGRTRSLESADCLVWETRLWAWKVQISAMRVLRTSGQNRVAERVDPVEKVAVCPALTFGLKK